MSINNIITKTRNIKSKINLIFNKDDLWTVQEICTFLNTNIPKDLKKNDKFSMISTFEGVVLKDSLFVQYSHFPVEQAKHAMKAGGVKAILASEQIEDYPCIIVENVIDAVTKLCHAMRQNINVPVTVITGSIGKTTTKYFINSIYSQAKKTFCNITNGNTFYYIGFELQRFDKKAKEFIQEVSEDEIFGPRQASKILNPEIAIITNIDKSHIGELGGEENIIKSITGIEEGMLDEGTVIINRDDFLSKNYNFKHKTLSVAIEDEEADYVAKNIQCFAFKTEFDICYRNKQQHIIINYPGKHNIYCAMQAFAAADIKNIPIDLIVKGIEKYKPMGYRQNICKGFGKIIIADCYNASAKSITSAIEVMNKIKSDNKKVAILGDVAEIEGFQNETYSRIGNAINSSDIDILVTYGKDSKSIAEFIDKKIEIYHENGMSALTKRIKVINKRCKKNVYLFKGSRINKLENAILKIFPVIYIKEMLTVWMKYFNWIIRTL